jgi:hypothetical protein
MIRVAMKNFSHVVKDTTFGKLLKRPLARFMLGLILERECANFGATPAFVDRARLYTVRLQRLTCYLDAICHGEEGMIQFINGLRIPTVFDASYSGALIRRSMNLGIYVARAASPVVSPRTVATLTSVPSIAEPELAVVAKQTSAAFESRSDTAPDSRKPVPAASSMNMLNHTTSVQPAQIVSKIHAVSSQASPVVTQATQLVDPTTSNINTGGLSAIHGAFPQSDAMEDIVPEPTRPQQVGTTEPQTMLLQVINGAETSSDFSHDTNNGQDEMDNIQLTGQPTVVPNQSQNVPDVAPSAKGVPDSTIQLNTAPSSTVVVETNDHDMPDMLDILQPVHSTLGFAVQSNLAPRATTPLNTKDQDMSDAPPSAQPALASSRRTPEASTFTTTSSNTRAERPTSGVPLAPTTYPSSSGQRLVAMSFPDPMDIDSTIHSRAKSKAQANSSNHWSNGKTTALLEKVPDLHNDLRQALPKTTVAGRRNQFRDVVLSYIDNAKSATELARNLDHAMRSQLLTLADYNRLERYAIEARNDRMRAERQSAAMLNAGNPLHANNNQIAPSQAVINGTAQPANRVAPSGTSQAASSITTQPTNVSAPPQTTNTGATVFSATPARSESATQGPELLEETLTRLLRDAQLKTMSQKDEVSTMFSSMFTLSWKNVADVNVMRDYVINHARFSDRDSRGRKTKNIQWTIKLVQALVDDKMPSSCELLVWTCKEALNAQDVKVGEEKPGFANCEFRQKRVDALFRRISATNFELMREVYPEGCLTWDEMKDLAMKEDLDYYNKKSNPQPYHQYMVSRHQHWTDRANMKQYITDRIAAQSMIPSQATGPDPAGPPKAKRNIAKISNDHDKVSEEKDVDAMDEGKTEEQEAKEPDLKRFRDAPTEQEERAAMKEKTARRANDSGRDESMKRSRD